MKSAAVIGHPVAHSLSPAIFGFLASELHQRDFDYSKIDVEPTALESFVRETKAKQNWLGFNVTIPHKERILDFVDDVEPSAKAVGAVNVVALSSGRARGFNTDVLGLEESFDIYKIQLSGSSVLILGAGGAARAAAFAAAQKGANTIGFLNRNFGRANSIANEFSRLFPEVKFKSLQNAAESRKLSASLVIQATPVGMSGHKTETSDLELFNQVLETSGPGERWAFDLIYRPEKTAFLSEANDLGYQAIGGLTMLIGQAIATWEIWIGKIEDKKLMHAKLGTHLRKILSEAS